MDSHFPQNPPDDSSDEETTPVAIVATQEAMELLVKETDDERTPEGAACMVTYLNDRMIARSIVDPQALEDIEEKGIFDEPRQLGLAAVERDPGIQGRLFALVPAVEFRNTPRLDADEDDAEPWASSVPRFEDIQEADEEVDPEELVPVLLGHIVRFKKDRKHPDDLPSEAADILKAIVSPDQELKTIVDKMLEDLF